MRRAFRRLGQAFDWLTVPSKGVFSRFDRLCFYALTLGSCAELSSDKPIHALHSILFAMALAGWRYMSAEPFVDQHDDGTGDEERYAVDLAMPMRPWPLKVAPDERVHA